MLLRERSMICLTEMGEGVAQRGTGDLYQPSVWVIQLQDHKSEPAADKAQTSKTAITVALRGANRPILAKMMVSQKTSITMNGIGSDLCPICSMRSQLPSAISPLICKARD